MLPLSFYKPAPKLTGQTHCTTDIQFLSLKVNLTVTSVDRHLTLRFWFSFYLISDPFMAKLLPELPGRHTSNPHTAQGTQHLVSVTAARVEGSPDICRIACSSLRVLCLVSKRHQISDLCRIPPWHIAHTSPICFSGAKTKLDFWIFAISISKVQQQ